MVLSPAQQAKRQRDQSVSYIHMHSFDPHHVNFPRNGSKSTPERVAFCGKSANRLALGGKGLHAPVALKAT